MPQAAFFLAPIVAQTEDGGSWIGLVLPLIILGGLFYVMLYLPRRKQAKRAAELMTSIAIGDEIRTIGGVYGTVRSIDEETYTIDVGGGTTIRFAKRAIAARLGGDAA
jgi:preprotein translocase subunit YajC